MPLPEDQIRALQQRVELPPGSVSGTRLTWIGPTDDNVDWTSDPDSDIRSGDGDPNGVVFASKGTLYIDLTTPGLWQNDDGLTSWTQIPDTSTAATASSLSVFGDGSDGVVTFDGTTTVLGFVPAANVYSLTRDLYLADGSAMTGSAIIQGGYKIFCRGTFTIGASATIRNDGSAAVANIAGGGGGSTTCPGGTGGGNGGSGGNGSNAGNIAGNSAPLGAAGGAGGALSGGPGTGGGATGGTVTVVGVTGGPRNLDQAMSFLVGAAATGTYALMKGGAGGGGGNAAASSVAGGGGAGGNVLALYVQHLVNNGALTAKGGNGAAASGSGTGAGGGGGGGGGAVVLIYNTFTGNAPSVAGGGGGAAQGAGKNGAAGSTGTVFQIANA